MLAYPGSSLPLDPSTPRDDALPPPLLCLQIGADGSPILNARQRRTLRRAQDRAMKGLEEAGRVLLMQHGCIRGGSSGGGAGGDTEGTDAEGAESGAENRGDVGGTGPSSQGGRAGCREAS